MKNDALPIEGIDYVELYVGNAKQASYFYKNGFGFSPVAYSGPETGVKDKTSYLMQQGDIRLLITSSLVPDHPISRYVVTHGDGVADVAMRVKDVWSETRGPCGRERGGRKDGLLGRVLRQRFRVHTADQL